MTRLHVAAGVIRGADGRVLIARRPLDKHQGGLWEFPGGKVEAGETAEVALARELAEELGIVVTASRPLIQVSHDYADKQVLLDVWEVFSFTGEPHGADGQPLAWVSPSDLSRYSFPAANSPIVTAARLPDRYLVTPDIRAGELLSGLPAALAGGIRLVQLRAPSLAAHEYRALATDVLKLCAGQAQVLLKGPLEWADDFPDAGWHLTAAQLRRLAGCDRPLAPARWLAASCHDATETDLATKLGTDFVVLSPVLATATHPDAQPLGWQRAAKLLSGLVQPAYLLGGLGPEHCAQASRAGAQGIAAIRALWPTAF